MGKAKTQAHSEVQSCKIQSSSKGSRARVTGHTRHPTCHFPSGVFGFVIGDAIGSSAPHRLLISYCEMQAWRTMLHCRNALRFTDPCRILPFRSTMASQQSRTIAHARRHHALVTTIKTCLCTPSSFFLSIRLICSTISMTLSAVSSLGD